WCGFAIRRRRFAPLAGLAALRATPGVRSRWCRADLGCSPVVAAESWRDDGGVTDVDPYGRAYSAARRRASANRSAAAITAGACNLPGCRDSRSIGPETDTEATTLPDGERIAPDTEATPGSRSPTLWAQPRRRTADNVAALNFEPCRPRCSRSGSSQANRIWAADPACMGSCVPTGMVSRSPVGRSAAATHTRFSP